jgi:nicotinate dehydrogenase subunit A
VISLSSPALPTYPLHQIQTAWAYHARRHCAGISHADGRIAAGTKQEVAMATTSLNVNGKTVSVSLDDPDTPLLYVLRNELDLHGPRFGCGLGQCGACTVLMDGTAVRSCVTPLSAVSGRIVTLEGLGTDTKPHPLQAAFIEEQAVQCGYCINGMIMQSADLLARKPKPNEQEVKTELANNLCRCGTHLRIMRAVIRAAASS